MHPDWGTSVVDSATAEPRPIADPPPLRLVRPKHGPTLSVVLATHGMRSDLGDALPPLAVLCAQLGAELLVIGADIQIPLGRSASRHVRYVSAPAGASTSQMRELAMSQCTGDIVVLLDDSADSDRSWVERVRASARGVAGRNGDDASGLRAAVDWSSYFNGARALDD
ncbi:MAG TPA: hypothetical protein VJ650_14320 [Gemmatimonadaceae bacterium]|nr:hypothetical protein [Gemmatimonadaceae bacterium]